MRQQLHGCENKLAPGSPHLKGLFVDINFISNFCLLGLAEENEMLKEEDAAQAFLLPKENSKLILSNELTLFF